MSHMLQNIPPCFQRSPVAPGFSVRHMCNMESLELLDGAVVVTPQEASDFVLVSEFERLGADPLGFAKDEREVR